MWLFFFIDLRHSELEYKIGHHEYPDAMDEPELNLDETGPLVGFTPAIYVVSGDKRDDAHADCEWDVDPKWDRLDCIIV